MNDHCNIAVFITIYKEVNINSGKMDLGLVSEHPKANSFLGQILNSSEQPKEGQKNLATLSVQTPHDILY